MTRCRKCLHRLIIELLQKFKILRVQTICSVQANCRSNKISTLKELLYRCQEHYLQHFLADIHVYLQFILWCRLCICYGHCFDLLWNRLHRFHDIWRSSILVLSVRVHYVSPLSVSQDCVLTDLCSFRIVILETLKLKNSECSNIWFIEITFRHYSYH